MADDQNDIKSVEEIEAKEVLSESLKDISPEDLMLSESVDVGESNTEHDDNKDNQEVTAEASSQEQDRQFKTEGGSRICPRCGWDTTQQAPQPTEEDFLDYVTAILGNRRFTKIYTFMDGQLRFKFAERTDAETQVMYRFIRQWTAKENIADAVHYMSQFRRLQTATTLQKIETPDFVFTMDDVDLLSTKDYQQYFELVDKKLGELNDSLYAQAYQLSWEFNGLIGALIQKVMNENL